MHEIFHFLIIYFEDFFFEVNTKYISSSAVKNQYFWPVLSKIENADIFTT